MVSVAEPGASLLTSCILMAGGHEASFALQRKGTLMVARAQHLTYSSQHSCSHKITHFLLCLHVHGCW